MSINTTNIDSSDNFYDNFDSKDYNPKKTQNIQFKKYGRKEWLLVEKKLDDTTLEVIQVLKDLGSGIDNKKDQTQDIKTCGDEVYEGLRPKIEKLGLVPPKSEIDKLYNDKNNKNSKNGKK